MKRFKSIVSIGVVSSIIIASPIVGLANNGKKNSNNGKAPIKQEKIREEKVKEEKILEEEIKEVQEKRENEKNNNGDKQGKGQDKSWKEAKELLQVEKNALENKKDEIEVKKDELEKQLKEAEKSENKDLIDQLKTEISEIEKQRLEIKLEMKNTINSIKEVVKNKYSVEELEALRKIEEEFKEQDGDIVVIPVENINTKKRNIKFDTPPVIKEGRTLIPVRAITQGFGADLEWKAEEKKVIIKKGDTEIILQLDNNIAIVNGEEIELEVPSMAFNNRTYVPLRFIIEKLGLNIEYDEDTGLIEIDNEDDEDISEEEDLDDEEDADKVDVEDDED